MEKVIYLAYGSNLNAEQMHNRCADAKPMGLSEIKDYELLFKKSRTGYYATIEPKKGSVVPVLVWTISKADEESLDVYEGFPAQYQKVYLAVEVKSLETGAALGEYEGLAYVLPEDRELGQPTDVYYEKLAKGYEQFGFDRSILEKGYKDSFNACIADKKVQDADA